MNAPVDHHASLPPHMAEAAVTAGLAPSVCRRFSVLTRAWYFDGVAAVDSDMSATWPAPDGSLELAGYVCSRQTDPSGTPIWPSMYGRDAVRLGSIMIATPYYDYVVALWPGVTWETGVMSREGALITYAVALSNGRPVALVMPLRKRKVTRG